MQTREINHKTNLLHHPEANSLLELIEHTKDAIVLCDANREIVSWNKGAEKMFGYTKAEVMHKIPLDLGLLTLSPEEISELDTSLFTSETWNGIKVFTTKQGEKIYGTITANAIKNESGGLNSVLFIVKDDTKKKKYTEKLKKNNSHLKKKWIKLKNNLQIVNVYVPSGRELNCPQYYSKLTFLESKFYLKFSNNLNLNNHQTRRSQKMD